MTNDTVQVPRSLFARMALLSVMALQGWADEYHERNPQLDRPRDGELATSVVLKYITEEDMDRELADHVTITEEDL